MPVPQFVEETVEMVKAPRERVQRRTVDVPMPQMLEETFEVVKLARMNECNIEPPSKLRRSLSFAEETVELVRLVPQERVQWMN